MTYLTKEDWDKNYVQNICDDKSFYDSIKEKLLIQNTLIFLLNKLFKKEEKPQTNKLNKTILYPSLIFFHKYLLSKGISFLDLSYIDKMSLYSACIFLSLKIQNKLIHISDISNKFLHLFNNTGYKVSYKIEDVNKLIINKESDILFSIQFEVNIDWPYNKMYLIENYLNKIGKNEEMIKSIKLYVNRKINEIISFPLYLYYTPIEIIICSLILIKDENDLNFININDFIKVNNLVIDNDNIDECSKLMNKVIGYIKLVKNSKNNVQGKCLNENIEKEKINLKALSNIQTNN